MSLSLTVQTSLNEDWCLCEVGQDANGDVPFAGLSFDGSFVLWTTWQDADPSQPRPMDAARSRRAAR
ncbi:MAG: hypothetical protein WD009_13960 [Phycisphaeraceae bacterium]